MSKISGWHVLIVALILISTIIILNQLNGRSGILDKSRDTIQVSGTSDIDVEPDQAEVTLAIQTDAGAADTAQIRNKALTETLLKSFEDNNLKDDEIETLGFSLQKKERYDPQANKIVIEGYTLTNTLKLTITDLEKVGKIVDDAIAAGANRVDSIQFSLSKDAKQEANDLALEEASKNAEKKARALAKSLGVRIGRAISVSEMNYIFQPYLADYKLGAVSETAAPAEPEIPPQAVNIQLTVNVIFEIK